MLLLRKASQLKVVVWIVLLRDTHSRVSNAVIEPRYNLTFAIGKKSEIFDSRRTHGARRSSHRMHVVQGLFSNNDEEGRFENQFQVLGELGHGQFGVVLKVNDRLRGLEYAVKKSGRYEGIRHR